MQRNPNGRSPLLSTTTNKQQKLTAWLRCRNEEKENSDEKKHKKVVIKCELREVENK